MLRRRHIIVLLLATVAVFILLADSGLMRLEARRAPWEEEAIRFVMLLLENRWQEAYEMTAPDYQEAVPSSYLRDDAISLRATFLVPGVTISPRVIRSHALRGYQVVDLSLHENVDRVQMQVALVQVGNEWKVRPPTPLELQPTPVPLATLTSHEVRVTVDRIYIADGFDVNFKIENQSSVPIKLALPSEGLFTAGKIRFPSGTVVDSTLVYSVGLKSTDLGPQTDAKGRYFIVVKPGQDIEYMLNWGNIDLAGPALGLDAAQPLFHLELYGFSDLAGDESWGYVFTEVPLEITEPF